MKLELGSRDTTYISSCNMTPRSKGLGHKAT